MVVIVTGVVVGSVAVVVVAVGVAVAVTDVVVGSAVVVVSIHAAVVCTGSARPISSKPKHEHGFTGTSAQIHNAVSSRPKQASCAFVLHVTMLPSGWYITHEKRPISSSGFW